MIAELIWEGSATNLTPISIPLCGLCAVLYHQSCDGPVGGVELTNDRRYITKENPPQSLRLAEKQISVTAALLLYVILFRVQDAQLTKNIPKNILRFVLSNCNKSYLLDREYFQFLWHLNLHHHCHTTIFVWGRIFIIFCEISQKPFEKLDEALCQKLQ